MLGWLIGNEVNLGLSGQALADWYVLANRLAEVAYVEEGATYHPTILVNAVRDFGNVDNHSDDISLNFVDMWGHNTYFGWDGHCYFEYYDRTSAKPLVFTEFGVDAWDSQGGAPFPAMQAAYEERQRSMDYIDYQRTNYIRGEQDWISKVEGGTIYHTDTWGTKNTATGEYWKGQPYDYVHFKGENPKYREQMTTIDSRQLWERHIRTGP